MPIEEGIYFDMPESVYRADPAISQSLLKDFGAAATPKHFKAAKRKEPTPDMEFGTVCHAAILQPDKLHLAYYERPEKYPHTPKPTKADPFPAVEMKDWTGNSSWCKEWLDKHADRPIMTREQLDKIPKIVERMKSLPEFGEALRVGKTEVAFFKRDTETGLMLKCRCDLVAETAGGETWIFDPKKVQIGEANHDSFSKQAYNFGYHIQAYSYLEITGASRFVFVPFDDDEPFDACQWQPSSEFLMKGREDYRKLLDAYAKCVKEDKWPGYAAGIGELGLPKFVKL